MSLSGSDNEYYEDDLHGHRQPVTSAPEPVGPGHSCQAENDLQENQVPSEIEPPLQQSDAQETQLQHCTVHEALFEQFAGQVSEITMGAPMSY